MTASSDRQAIPILFVLPNFKAGGAERVALTLLSGLDRTRFTPELAVLDGRGEFAEVLPKDVKCHDLGAARLRSALLPLLQLIGKRRPAVVFSTHSYVNLSLLILRAMFPGGTKLVVREPSTPSRSLSEGAVGRLLHLGYRMLLRRADLAICLNSLVEGEMRSTYRVPPSRLVRMPNPVNVAELREGAEPMVREPGAGLRLIAAGRLSQVKGYDRLLKAMASMPDDSVLTLYGTGPEQESLKALAASLDLGPKVRFAGFRQQLAPALAGADAVVVSSRWEGMPNIVLEAFACGTPVVSTREAGGVIDLAQELSTDALRLVSSETELAEAMAGVKLDHHVTVRPSLLPHRFEEHKVMEFFAEMLERTRAGQSQPVLM